MANEGIGGLSDSFRIAEYDTYFKASPPQVVPAKHVHEGIRLDAHAKFAAEKARWIYPISTRTEDGFSFIEFEAKVEPDGTVLHPDDHVSPTLKIPDRPAVLLFDPDDEKRLSLRKVDDDGNAIVTRLLLCPFRLDSVATKLLCSPGFNAHLRAHIPSLWQWSKDPAGSAFRSSDGWFLKEHRHFLNGADGLERVWVGVDPFAIARRLSDIYVDPLKKYQEEYEPSPDDQEGVEKQQRRAFLKMVNALAASDKTPAKYRGALDESRVFEEFKHEDTAEKTLRGEATKAIEQLIRHLANPFFELLQFSSLKPEGFDETEDEYSEALLEHMETLDYVLRMFDKTAKGQAYLLAITQDAAENELHVINHFVFPPRQLSIHAFKTTRWGSKSALSLAKTLYPPMCAALNVSADTAVRNAAASLARIGVFESVAFAEGRLKLHELDLSKLTEALGSKKEVKILKVRLFAAEAANEFEEFIKKDRTVLGQKLNADHVAGLSFAVLDLLNAAIAYKAWRDAEGEDAIQSARFNLAATTAFTVSAVVESLMKLSGKPPKGLLLRTLSAARGLGGIIFAALNFKAGLKSWRNKDYDHAITLFAAGFAEAFAAGVMLYQVFAGVAVFAGPLAIVGAVAGLLYILSLGLKNDPIEMMLRNCEFGREPYALGEDAFPWSRGSVTSWQGDIKKQMQVYATLMSGFRLHWKRELDGSEASVNPQEIRVTCGFSRPSTTMTIVYFTDAPSGSGTVRAAETLQFSGENVPQGDHAFSPSQDFIAGGAKNMLVTARLVDPSLDLDLELSGVLLVNGAHRDTHDANLVEIP